MKKYLLFLLAGFLFTASASAAIVYQDSFDGDGATPLNGQAPDVAPDGITWLAGEEIAANGYCTDNGSTAEYGASAYLPVTLVADAYYVLTADLDCFATDNNWAAIGFTESTSPSDRFMETGVYFWALSRGPSATDYDQAFGGARTANGLGNSSTIAAQEIVITIDTAGGACHVEVSFDGVDTLTYDADAIPSGISYVAFSSCNSDMQMNSFQFEAYLPSAGNPSPQDGLEDVDTEVTFSWSEADAPAIDPNVDSYTLNYLVYDAADAPAEPNFPNAAVVTSLGTSYGPLTIGTDKIVYWRVDSVLDYIDDETGEAAFVKGDPWSFATITTAPEILSISDAAISYPYDYAGVNPATGEPRYQGDVEFVCEMQSYSAVESIVWTKDSTGETVASTESSDGIAHTSSIVISDIEAADQAVYTCTITAGGKVASASTGLVVCGQISDYAFDADLNDSISGVVGAMNVGPAVFADGAVELDGSDAVELGSVTEGYPKGGLGNGLESGTISMWVRLDAIADGMDNAMLMGVVNGLFNDGEYDWIEALQMWVDGSSLNYRVRGYVNGTVNSIHAAASLSDSIIGDGQLHMITATYTAGGSMQLYLDGAAVGSAVSYPAGITFNDWDYPIMVGANYDRDNGANGNIDGAIADLAIYNYAKDAFEVVDMYVDVVPDANFCLLDVNETYDFVDDCKIDVKDFAILAQKWLDCGIYPASACD